MKTQGQGRFRVFAHHPAGQSFPVPATGLSPGSQKLSLMEPRACPKLGSVKRQILGCRPASCISEGDCSRAVSATSHSGMSSAHFPPDPEVCPSPPIKVACVAQSQQYLPEHLLRGAATAPQP